eukprot:TRINITY_DN6065_c0_g1_i1.p1 TRINITY_DN6065_c0_g1~~TRINITY_DN6065_c0_g1_i1.p1  ORF type:complete len:342 (-),score=58.38 TRINITY_DN6065_c0_g1_i1:51-1076(-)
MTFRIDVHTHIIPKDLPNLKEKYGVGGFVNLEFHQPCKAKMLIDGKLFREIEENCWNTNTRIKECDKTNVQVQVLSTIPVLFNYWAKPEHALDSSRYLNDHIAKSVEDNPKRFVGLGTLPMQAPDLAIKELRRCVLDLGLSGVQIGTHVNDWNLDAKELFPFFEEASRLGACIFVHPWDMVGKERMQNYWMPWLVGMPAETCIAITSLVLGGVLEKLPNLKIGFAHGGGSFPYTIGRIEKGFKVRPDLCAVNTKTNPREFMGKFWVDSLVHDPKSLEYLIDVVGPSRIMLGSDYPFPLGEECPGSMVESMKLPRETQEMIFADSALEFLGLTKDKFIKIVD